MRSLYTTILALGLLLSEQQVYAQAHNVSAGYQKPVDPLVIENLESWQDMKFGLFMHWGTYSQWGIVESWSLCPEDEGWTQRKAEHGKTYYEYVKNYENLQTTFNPTAFNPKKMGRCSKSSGHEICSFHDKAP